MNNSHFGILVVLILFIGISPHVLAQEEPEDERTPFIHIELVVRNPEGQLVTYLEHYFFRIIEMEQLNSFIDYTINLSGKKYVDFGGEKYEMIVVKEEKIWDFEQVRTIDELTIAVNGIPTKFVEYDHDAYVLYPGDERTVIWTILRPER